MQRGKLSGPSSQVASKSHKISLQASFSVLTPSGIELSGTVVSMSLPVMGLVCTEVLGKVARKVNSHKGLKC